jgi:hypothetical protein
MIGLLLLAFGQSVELPATIRAMPGTFVLVKPVRLEGGKAVRYFSPDAGLSTFPNELLNDPTATVVVASRPGTYRIYAVTAKDYAISPVAQSVILVGDIPEPGPNPNPGPGPVPPGPGPVPPGPAPGPVDISKDPLFLALQSVAGGLQEQNQKQNFGRMAAAWAKADTVLETSKTLGEATSGIRKEQTAQGLSISALTAIRERIWGEVADTIGADPNLALDSVTKEKLSALAKRLAAIFKKLAE